MAAMIKTCVICGNEFETNIKSKKYCSPECWREGKRINARKNYQKHRVEYLAKNKKWRDANPDYHHRPKQKVPVIIYPCRGYGMYDLIPEDICLNCSADECRYENTEK